MVALIKLSYEIASGAQVSYDFDVAVNPSEGDIAGRIAMRAVKREYMLSVNPAQSSQIVNSIMALRGARYALVLRDYADNYQLTDEVLPHTGTTALLGRTWAPSVAVNASTGAETTSPLSVFERILVIDTKQTSFIVKKNGVSISGMSPAAYSISDFGEIDIPGLTGPDVVTVTGQYLVPVTIVDAPSTTVITNSNGTTIHRFADIRLRQIFDSELVSLTS